MKIKLLLLILMILLSACSFNKGKSEGFIYVVKSGDTLSKISSEYNVPVSALMYYNDKYFADLIIGERLYIPLANHDLAIKETYVKDNQIVEKEYNSLKSKDGLLYKVKAGDTLYGISRNFGLTVSQLKEINNLDTDLISIDQELYIKKFEAKKKQKKNIEEAKKKDKISQPKISQTGTKSSTLFSSPNEGKASSFPQEWKNSYLLPVSGRISSPFGMRRGSLHKGVDITAPPGTEIKAAYSGTVSYTGFLRDYGNVIVIEHGKDVVTVYAHNEINLVKKSDKVNKGDIIARLGSTGRSTGPHLHFEIRVANKPIDPAKIISEINTLKKI